MSDDLPGWLIGGVIAVAVLLACLLLGSCVRDYTTSTPQVVEVLITDKNYYPEHYDTHCSTDRYNHTTCHQSYVPPSWTVEYADAQRWTLNVSKGTWEALRIGERKVLRYDLGGGYWHARYNERFTFGPIAAEGAAWPTR